MYMVILIPLGTPETEQQPRTSRKNYMTSVNATSSTFFTVANNAIDKTKYAVGKVVDVLKDLMARLSRNKNSTRRPAVPVAVPSPTRSRILERRRVSMNR